jgi:hypothetical protein
MFLAIAAGAAILLILCALSVDAYVDPLWVLPKIGSRNLLYCVADERQNKINRAIHGELDTDSLLVGSSRSAFIDTRYFQKNNVFNMAVNGIHAIEYGQMVDIYRRHVGAPRVVYLGVDFFTYSYPWDDSSLILENKKRESQSADLLYVPSHLMDLAVFNAAIDTIRRCSAPGFLEPTYRYSGVRYVPFWPPSPERAARLRGQTIELQALFTESQFKPDPAYPEKLRSVQEAAPRAKVVAFIPPVSSSYFLAVMSERRIDDYVKWLSLVIDAYGSLVNFSGINTFTLDDSQFYDVHHLYSTSWKSAVDIMEGRTRAHPDGFGETLTKDNLAAYAGSLRTAVCAESLKRSGDELTDVPGCPGVPQHVAQAPKPATADETVLETVYAFAVEGEPNWRPAMPLTSIQAAAEGLLLKSARSMMGYQLISNEFTTVPGGKYTLSFDASVEYGHLTIGILDTVEDKWVVTGSLVAGAAPLHFTAPSARASVVVANDNKAPTISVAVLRKIKVDRNE